MPMIHVCSLSRLARHRARNRRAPCRDADQRRHAGAPARRRSRRSIISFSTWTTSPTTSRAMWLRARSMSANCCDFVRRWDRATPLVVHCYAGYQPLDRGRVRHRLRAQSERDEAAIARALRDASPTAMPNIRIVVASPTACWAAMAAWSRRSVASARHRGLCERSRSASHLSSGD